MNATAILVTFNSGAVIGAALASLPATMPAIVVDNASVDESAALANAAGATVLQRQVNAGFGVANNEGWRAAATEWVLFLNPDATLRPGCWETLDELIANGIDADVLVPTVLTKGGVSRKWSSPVTIPAFSGRKAPDGLTPISFASGAAILMRRALLERLGGFDEAIFLYFEDDDLSRRALDAGATILHVAGAEVLHVGNVSSPSSVNLAYIKAWHLAWSERHVRRKFGLAAPGVWRLGESAVKLLWAQLRGRRMEEAKQMGLINGTLAHMRGIPAQQTRDTLVMERE